VSCGKAGNAGKHECLLGRNTFHPPVLQLSLNCRFDQPCRSMPLRHQPRLLQHDPFPGNLKVIFPEGGLPAARRSSFFPGHGRLHFSQMDKRIGELFQNPCLFQYLSLISIAATLPLLLARSLTIRENRSASTAKGINRASLLPLKIAQILESSPIASFSTGISISCAAPAAGACW